MALQKDRDALKERCVMLYQKKDAELNAGVSWDYDREVLVLIRDILVHTKDHWKQESDHQRKGSLNNIVRMSLLLSRQFKCIYNKYYAAKGDQGEYINIWRNLDFLVSYQITEPDPRFHQSLPITSEDINDLFKELFRLIDPVLKEEIRVGLRVQPIVENLGKDSKLPVDIRKHFKQCDVAVRKPHRDPNKLPLLEAFATHGREKLRISRMLSAIQFARTIDVSTPHGKMALLRQLQILGESCSGKNLSTATKRLRQDIDWQLLVNLRNKLSHNEWDIHRNFLNTKCTAKCLEAIQEDLKDLEASIILLQLDHNQIGEQRERILQHYDPAWYLRPGTQELFKGFIRGCHLAGLIDDGKHIELSKLVVDGDIRTIAVLDVIKDSVKQIFDKSFPGNELTRHLLISYQPLQKAFSRDIWYHKDQEHPKAKSLKEIDKRLACHQVKIRSLHDALNFDEESYFEDQAKHQASFAPSNIICLLRADLKALRTILDPITGSDVLYKQDFPEDATVIQDQQSCEIVTRVFEMIGVNDSHEMRDAKTQIINYCEATKKPLTLNLDGLHAGVKRGELQTVNLASIDGIRSDVLLSAVKNDGAKCQLYNALLKDPEVVQACFYHLARIQKYTVILSRCPSVDATRLPSFEEFKALRDFIHHGCSFFNTLSIEPLEIMARYASLFVRQVSPAIDQIAIDQNKPSVLQGNAAFYRSAANIKAQSLSPNLSNKDKTTWPKL
ncbi:hypothetical protein N9Y17_01235 [Gammaproteobacteria bacterium]|nr:hypothetical protein [Gammaproteobacteria bacterium]